MGELIGRLHPLIVHLPIGILILAFLMEVASYSKRYKKLKVAMPFVLKVVIASSLIAWFTGWIMPKEGAFDERLVSLHFWMATGMVVSSLFLYFLYEHKSTLFRRLYLPCFLLALSFLTLAGHFGGSLTHGEDFLTAPLSNNSEQIIEDIDSMDIYAALIRPLLENKCYNCHNAGKQKGGLNMKTEESFLAGGDNGPIVLKGNALLSPLVKRILLPIEEKEHMPPKGKKQPTSDEIALLEWWIEKGHPFKKKIGSIERSEAIDEILKGYEKSQEDIDIEKLEPLSASTLDKLSRTGIRIHALSETNPFLVISMGRDSSITKQKLNKIFDLGEHVYELDLASSGLSENMLSNLKKLKNLRILKLQDNPIGNSVIKYINSLKKLKSLNIYNTEIDDAGLMELSETKTLETVYVWKSKATQNGIKKYNEMNPLVTIQNGIDSELFQVAQLKPPIIQTENSMFEDSTSVELIINFRDVDIYYTLDGSMPDTSSTLYKEPFLIHQTTTVKAISVKKDWLTSETENLTITKAGYEIAQVILSNPPSEKYSGKEESTLSDLNLGSLRFNDGSWLGYEGKDVTITIDLGSTQLISNVTLGALEDTGSYIFFPKKIDVSTSLNNRNYSFKSNLKIATAREPHPAEYRSFSMQIDKHEARYIQLNIKGTLKNPEWHPAPGAKNWIFIDEVIIN